MICLQCQKEFQSVRVSAKYCSNACKMKSRHAKSYTLTEKALKDTITKLNDKVSVSPQPVECQKTRAETNYYHSKKYLDLIKHLEETSIEDLRKEGTWIPCWKYASMSKRPDLKEMFANLHS